MAAKLSMRQNLIVFVTSALCALAICLVLFIVYARKTTEDINRVINVENAASILLHEMWADGLQTEQALRNVMLNPTDTKAMANYEAADKSFVAANDKAIALANEATRKVLLEIKKEWSAAGGVKEEIRNLAISNRPQQAVEALNSRETPLWRGIKANILKLIEAQKATFAMSFVEHKKGAALGETVFIAVVACCILALLFHAILLDKAITRPMAAMIEYSRKIAADDFSATVVGTFASEFENLKTQFGDSLEIGEEFKWEWVSIPHIYHTPFYVYAYAFGQLLVLSLYSQFKQEGDAFKPRYINILSSGGSKAPVQILKEAGVDVYQAAFWQGGFDVVDGLIAQLENLA